MLKYKMGLPDHSVGKESACSAGETGDTGLISGSGRSPGGRNGNPLQYSPGKFHGQRSLVHYSGWGCKELDMTECMTPEGREPRPQCDLRRRVLRITEPQSTGELLQQSQRALSPRYLNTQAIIAY